MSTMYWCGDSAEHMEEQGEFYSPKAAAAAYAFGDALPPGAPICVGWGPEPNPDYDEERGPDEWNSPESLSKTAQFTVVESRRGLLIEDEVPDASQGGA